MGFPTGMNTTINRGQTVILMGYEGHPEALFQGWGVIGEYTGVIEPAAIVLDEFGNVDSVPARCISVRRKGGE